MLTTSSTTKQDNRWQSVIMITLAFWLSGSVIIDVIIMPGLAAAGMTTQPGFASAGYLLFEIFNHLELLFGAVVLTGLLVLNSGQESVPESHQESIQGIIRDAGKSSQSKRSILLSGILLAISLIYTYILTPEMSGWGLQLNLFEPVSSLSGTMIQMQYGYWLLELGKLAAGTLILLDCKQN